MLKMNKIKITGTVSGLNITEESIRRAIVGMAEKDGLEIDIVLEKEDCLSDENLMKSIKDMAEYAEERVIKPIQNAIKEILKNT